MANRFKGHVLLWITVILWGVSFVATKIVVEYIPPVSAALIRFLIASIFLIIFVKKRIKYSKKEFLFLSIAAFFGITAYFLFENTALIHTTASNGALIISTTPIVFLIFSDIVKRKFSNKIRYFGTLIAFIGVAVLVFNGRFILDLNPIGDLLMFGSVISWVLYTVYLEKLHHYDNLPVTKDLNILGMIFFVPFSLIEIVRSTSEIDFSIFLNFNAVMGLLYLGIFCSAVGYIFWNSAIRLVGAKTTMNGIYFIPVVTVISEAILLKTIPNLFTIIGAVLVISGTYVSEMKGKKAI